MMKLNIGKDMYLKGRIGWRGLSKNEYLDKSEYKIINATALNDGLVDYSNCGYISKGRFEESDDIIVKNNDILISKDGTLGKIGYVKDLNENLTVASGIFILRNTSVKELNMDYLYHILKSDIFKSFINKKKALGSTINHLYQRDLEQFEIDMPNFKQQSNISNILNQIESKIDINNKIILKLESMMKDIYDYWFVQFDFPNEKGKPYKSSGGKMVYNEKLKREVPFCFTVETLVNNKISTVIKPGVDKFNEKIYFATADVNNINISDGSVINYNNRETRANMQPTLYSIWFAKMKNSIKHLFLNENMISFINNSILSTGFLGIQCDKRTFEYIACFIKNENFEYRKDQLCHGATQEAVNNEDLNKIYITIPSSDIINNFHILIKPLFEKISMLICMNKKLKYYKNFILPLLMNGQVEVK